MTNASFNAFGDALVIGSPVADEDATDTTGQSDVVFPFSVVTKQVSKLVIVGREITPCSHCVCRIREVAGRDRKFHRVGRVVDGDVVDHAES